MPTPDVNDALTKARQRATITGYRQRVWFDTTRRQWRITPTRTRYHRHG